MEGSHRQKPGRNGERKMERERWTCWQTVDCAWTGVDVSGEQGKGRMVQQADMCCPKGIFLRKIETKKADGGLLELEDEGWRG
jgi:hypothetical protein